MFVRLLMLLMLGLGGGLQAADLMDKPWLTNDDLENYRASFEVDLAQGNYDQVINDVQTIFGQQQYSESQYQELMRYWERAESAKKRQSEAILAAQSQQDNILPLPAAVQSGQTLADQPKYGAAAPAKAPAAQPKQTPMSIHDYRGLTARSQNANDSWSPASERKDNSRDRVSAELQSQFDRRGVKPDE